MRVTLTFAKRKFEVGLGLPSGTKVACFCTQNLRFCEQKHEVALQKKREIMNLQIFFQLAALLFIVGAGPLVVVLLASRGGNL